MTELNFNQAINICCRLIANNLQRQAPRKTGELIRSIKVTGSYDGKSVKFNSDYVPYGVYTDLGTGPYKAKRSGGNWNPAPGKGRGGIKPRFWTTLDESTRQRVNKIISKVVSDFIKFNLYRK